MGVICWLILGIVAGVVLSYFTRRVDRLGYLINALVGVIGALLGGFCANLVMRLPPLGFSLSSFLVAILGTLVFLFIAKTIQKG